MLPGRSGRDVGGQQAGEVVKAGHTIKCDIKDCDTYVPNYRNEAVDAGCMVIEFKGFHPMKGVVLCPVHAKTASDRLAIKISPIV